MVGRRSLQIVTAILAVIPVVTGLIGLSRLRDPLYRRANLYPVAGSSRTGDDTAHPE